MKFTQISVLAAALFAAAGMAHSAPQAAQAPDAQAQHHHGGYGYGANAGYIEFLRSELAKVRQQKQQEEANLANFDDLDFNVYTNQKWDELKRSHADDIVVHWPDGRITVGIQAHIDDLKGDFLATPDNHIKEHPIRIASGEWTAVTGFNEGTFTQPMTMADGRVIQPTGKAYKVPMVTIGHWKDGKMDEEYLMWDTATYFKQIGVTP